jgi:hypothetical protein
LKHRLTDFSRPDEFHVEFSACQYGWMSFGHAIISSPCATCVVSPIILHIDKSNIKRTRSSYWVDNKAASFTEYWGDGCWKHCGGPWMRTSTSCLWLGLLTIRYLGFSDRWNFPEDTEKNLPDSVRTDLSGHPGLHPPYSVRHRVCSFKGEDCTTKMWIMETPLPDYGWLCILPLHRFAIMSSALYVLILHEENCFWVSTQTPNCWAVRYSHFNYINN